MVNIEIRERNIADVNEFIKFLLKLDSEAEYMLYEKGERNINKDRIQKNIESIIEDGDSCYIALVENKIIGYIIGVREKFVRTNHVASVVAGILEDYCGKGIGYSLFNKVLDWADASNVKRLELTVIKDNKRAINLYNKLDFEIEGIRKKSTLKDGKYYDELYMSRIN